MSAARMQAAFGLLLLVTVVQAERSALAFHLFSAEQELAVDCIDVNTASIRTLQKIKGIGPSTANEILYRRCYDSVEDFLEQFTQWQTFGNIKALVKSGDLCVASDCDARVVSGRAVQDGCVDVNTASVRALTALEGIGKPTARMIRDGRCYHDTDEFKEAFYRYDQWGGLEALLASGRLCVASECPEEVDDISDSSTNDEDEPEPEPAAAFQPIVHSKWSLDVCASKKKLPSTRKVEDGPSPDSVLNAMRYTLFIHRKRKPMFAFVKETPERRAKCLEVFAPHPNRSSIPTSSDMQTFVNSSGVCVLVGIGDSEVAMEYSEYNAKRHVPNFVAYKLINSKSKYEGKRCRSKWLSVCPAFPEGTKMSEMEARCEGLVDSPFGPSSIISTKCPVDDAACSAAVNTRGHMRPVKQSSFSLPLCSATMNFINVFPSRNDGIRNVFDGRQWAAREAHVVKYMGSLRSSGKLPAVWVVVGTSKESDGMVVSAYCDQHALKSMECTAVDVPSFIWTAVYDPYANKATGWLCRNGLSPNDECYCIDELSVRDLEVRVGHRIFPQLENTTGLDLASGRHDAFWANFDERH